MPSRFFNINFLQHTLISGFYSTPIRPFYREYLPQHFHSQKAKHQHS